MDVGAAPLRWVLFAAAVVDAGLFSVWFAPLTTIVAAADERSTAGTMLASAFVVTGRAAPLVRLAAAALAVGSANAWWLCLSLAPPLALLALLACTIATGRLPSGRRATPTPGR
jgi:hypothetical protein